MDAHDTPDIDTTDFTILFTVQQHNTPPWKNKIHGWIVDNEADLPLTDGVSVQTVGRRVDDLVQDDLLETVIVSPDDIKRDLIIAFRLTDAGEAAIAAKREDLLKQTVRHHIFDESVENTMGENAIITLLLHKFGWAPELRDELRQRYDAEELATFLVMTYIDEQAENILGGDVQQFRDLLARYDDMADTLLHQIEGESISQ